MSALCANGGFFISIKALCHQAKTNNVKEIVRHT